MPYELRDHTADIAVAASGSTLSALFAAVADGLTAASCESVPEAGGDRFAVDVVAESGEALLFEYLDRLIYERDVRSVLPADHEACVIAPPESAMTPPESAATDADGGAISDDPDWRVEATARGVPLTDVAAREVKAVTYSEMVLERRDGDWHAYVVFDV